MLHGRNQKDQKPQSRGRVNPPPGTYQKQKTTYPLPEAVLQEGQSPRRGQKRRLGAKDSIIGS